MAQAGQPPATRGPLWRILEIHEAIQSGTFPNCSDFMKRFEVSRQTVLRDLDHMRDFWKLPLEYDAAKHGYRYTEQPGELPVMEVGAGELTVMFLMRQALEAVRGTELEAKVWNLLSKVTLHADERVRFSWSEAERVFSHKTTGRNRVEAEVLGKLGDAVLRQREVSFLYRKHASPEPERRKVRPYHLGQADGCWYLIGHDLEREALRTFALPRMREVRVLQGRFERPADFDGRSHFAGAFGIWTDGNDGTTHEVRIALRGFAARLARERRWHPSQQVIELPCDGDDRVEVRFQVPRIEEVVRWVLGWGSRARPLAPEALVEAVQAELRAMDEPWEE